MRFVVFLCSFLLTMSVSASKIVVNDTSYANKKLTFYHFSDAITRQPEMIFTLQLDADGKADYNYTTNHAHQLFCDFGVYRGFFVLEKNSTVELRLPPLKEKTINNRKNPFFQPVEFWFREKNEKGINNQISNFNIDLNELLDKNLEELYYAQPKSVFDSIKIALTQQYENVNKEVFRQHMKNKITLLEWEVFRKKTKGIAAKLSDVKDTYWNHISFITLFNTVFSKKMTDELQKSSKLNLPKVIYTKDVKALSNYVKNEYKLSGNLNKLVVLKFLYDGFYSNKYDNERIEQMIALPYFSTSGNALLSATTKNILQKIIHLKVGSKASVICLENLKGAKICTDNPNEKFKYILFADIDIMVNREQLKYLTEIEKKLEKYVDFYIVLRPSERDKEYSFFYENSIVGEKMVDAYEDIISQYKVRTFPSAILLDKNHRVVLKNTKSPLDGFEHQFKSLLKQTLFYKKR